MTIRGITKMASDRVLRKEFPMLKVGDQAPEFEVSDHLGRQVKLADYKGRNLVLWFFPVADTPG